MRDRELMQLRALTLLGRLAVRPDTSIRSRTILPESALRVRANVSIACGLNSENAGLPPLNGQHRATCGVRSPPFGLPYGFDISHQRSRLRQMRLPARVHTLQRWALASARIHTTGNLVMGQTARLWKTVVERLRLPLIIAALIVGSFAAWHEFHSIAATRQPDQQSSQQPPQSMSRLWAEATSRSS